VARKAKKVKRELEELGSDEDEEKTSELEGQLEDFQDDFFYLHVTPRPWPFTLPLHLARHLALP